MKQGEFSQEKIVSILYRASTCGLAERGEQTIGAICREHNVTETTFYRVLPCIALRVDTGRKAYGGMMVSEASRLKELEKENARLKRLLAERDMEVDVLKLDFSHFPTPISSDFEIA